MGEKAAAALGGGHPEGAMSIRTPGDPVCGTQSVAFCITKCLQMEKSCIKALKWSGDSRALWGVLNTQEKDGVKNRVDWEPSAPGSPEKLVYKFIKGFQEPFLGVDVRT